MDATTARADACGSFEVRAFFLDAAEEPSDLRLLAVVDFFRTSDMVWTVVGVGRWWGGCKGIEIKGWHGHRF